MKSSTMLVAVFLLGGANSLAAQQPEPAEPGMDVGSQVEAVLEESGLGAAVESAAEAATPELRDAVEQLALVLGDIAVRVGSDPELRRSAITAVGGMIEVAQVVLAEQADALAAVLREAPAAVESEGVR